MRSRASLGVRLVFGEDLAKYVALTCLTHLVACFIVVAIGHVLHIMIISRLSQHLLTVTVLFIAIL